ncbi:protein-glutamate O-methyltransferase CheR [Metabacillus idriensis]|uniref:protein-glutamate O-methyltransferase n=1 Tax=Metabacillus idriensis TaxID=324768 RepID=A0A6I2MD92_9BACI|nr:protein-glutamate O-methyltransferase CheR [Metabacillus idriensis]MCM3596954.1 protein-glutamate O-methyltransferase CheR [Metabacillus idriensis]MRX55699.1 chemotaxis protein CheR [Metabacillus idriensis]OHR74592.1 chemotaxis protein CheR [Bacillus sp. HMSC76G11]
MEYMQFQKEFKKLTGIDLGLYKEAQMKRRITSLYLKRGYNSFKEYGSALQRDRELLYELLDRITINVTEFYRNRKRWDLLETELLPAMLSGSRPLRIWSAACSTGEEPYTIAMILSKYLPLRSIKILATDLDENVIARAKLGMYPERSLAELPGEMKSKYFVQDGAGYQISKEIIETVQFKKHNLLSDPFESGFDLIICRNVLIYFTEDAKNMLYHKFSRALKNGGIFFIGSTEQIFYSQQYDLESAGTFFYRKIQL